MLRRLLVKLLARLVQRVTDELLCDATPCYDKSMDRTDFVLAVLATAEGHELTPVQVQKLFFILDKRCADRVGGPFFDFAAYDYGPFDASVYREIERLADRGHAEVVRPTGFSMKTFRTTPAGYKRGAELLATLDVAVRDFAVKLTTAVRTMSFSELVSAVYREFPEMKANSIFRG